MNTAHVAGAGLTLPEATAILRVHFSGSTERSGPLSMGQADMLEWALSSDEPTNLGSVWQLPAGTTATAVVDALEQLLLRHESLRTKVRLDPEPVQLIASAGEIACTVYENFDSESGFADDLTQAWRAQPFDFEHDLPLRAAIVTTATVPTCVVIVLPHLAVDMTSIALLGREFTELVAGRPLPAPRYTQPVDLAELEREPSGLRRAESAAKHWESQLRRAPRNMLNAPGPVAECRPQPFLVVQSRAAAASLLKLSARTNASRTSLVLSAVCGLLGYYVSQTTCLLVSVSSQRLRPELLNYIGPLSRDALMAVDVDMTSFDQLARRLQQRAMFAYAKAGDQTQLGTMIERIDHERGTFYRRDIEFNDQSEYAEAMHYGLSLGDPGDEIRVTWLPPVPSIAMLSVRVVRVDEVLELLIAANSGALPQEQAELFGVGLMRIIEAAADRDLPLAELGSVTRLAALERGPNWLLIDSGWVDINEVRKLVSEALGAVPFHIAAVADTTHGHLLECYVAAKAGVLRTPESLHNACMRLLFRWPAAMAPHQYVVCTQAPAGLANTEEWRQLPRLAEGDGRGATVLV